MIKTKYIFITGGVISGLGKGISAASLGFILQSYGYKVAMIKTDPYLNVSAGTMRPAEHGETFITDDGCETDLDLGHYERFMGISTNHTNSTTSGEILLNILNKERELKYNGKCVEVVPHVPLEIIKKIESATLEPDTTNKMDFIICEIGGTVGEFQSMLYMEAIRLMHKKYKGNTCHIHVSFFPYLTSTGELKTKPSQMSLNEINKCGLSCDFLITRTETDQIRPNFDKICDNTNIDLENIIWSPNSTSVYDVPNTYIDQDLDRKILKHFNIDIFTKSRNIEIVNKWEDRLTILHSPKHKSVKIGIVCKYIKDHGQELKDSYISLVETLLHSGISNKVDVEIVWINTDEIYGLSKNSVDGFIIPQGWGSRGFESKLEIAKLARENNIPMLGLCYGMQIMIIEYFRNVLGLPHANSTEIDSDTSDPIFKLIESDDTDLDLHIRNMRLGSNEINLNMSNDIKLSSIYEKAIIYERHRHRYTFNFDYEKKIDSELKFSATSNNKGIKVLEAIECLSNTFYVGVQFHPEYKSAFLKSHPLFDNFIKVLMDNKSEG